jgi:hypothetical protein
VEALKLLALVNGGAAVAVLTYLGHLAKKGAASQALPDTRCALLLFALGLLAALLAFIVAYIAQSRLHLEHVQRRSARPVTELHDGGVWLGMFLALTSAGCFAAGAYVGAEALTLPLVRV